MTRTQIDSTKKTERTQMQQFFATTITQVPLP